MFVSQSGTRSLADLVANILIMTATDPKDMVYAILGLADNAWANQSRHPVTLPDYSPLTSVLDVYQDLVEHAIANGSLDIICMQRLYDRLEDGTWPSSVPDWSSSQMCQTCLQLPLGNFDTKMIRIIVSMYSKVVRNRYFQLARRIWRSVRVLAYQPRTGSPTQLVEAIEALLILRLVHPVL